MRRCYSQEEIAVGIAQGIFSVTPLVSCAKWVKPYTTDQSFDPTMLGGEKNIYIGPFGLDVEYVGSNKAYALYKNGQKPVLPVPISKAMTTGKVCLKMNICRVTGNPI